MIVQEIYNSPEFRKAYMQRRAGLPILAGSHDKQWIASGDVADTTVGLVYFYSVNGVLHARNANMWDLIRYKLRSFFIRLREYLFGAPFQFDRSSSC